MLEFYQAYADYEDLIDVTEELLSGLVREVRGDETRHVRGHEISLRAAVRALHDEGSDRRTSRRRDRRRATSTTARSSSSWC